MRTLLGLCLLSAAICFSPLAHAAQVKEVISPKGIKAWLVEERGLPLVAVKISFRGAGFAYDPADAQGRANMTAALLMEGAGGMNQREFAEALDAHAIQMNTGVEEDTFDVYFESLSEHKSLAFSHAALAISEPRFDAGAIERTKNQSLSVIRQQEQQPGYLVARALRKAAFGSHPYGYERLGTKDTLDNLSESDFRRVQKRFLTRQNMVIGVAGDISPEQLSALLDEHFGALPEKYDPDTKVEEVSIAAGAEPTVIEYDIPQTIVQFATQGVKRNDPNYIAAYVMNHILGGGGSLTSILGDELRETRGLTYSVGSFIEPMQHGALWRGGFSSRNEDARKAVNVLLASVKVFVEQGPTDKEVADAKQYLVDSFVLNLDSNADIASFLVNMQINDLGIDYMQRRNSMVASVQKAQIMEMARRMIDPEKMLLFMIGKPVTQRQQQEKNTAPATP